jgi:hypothetical protein
MGDLSIARAQGEAAQGRAQVEGAASTGAGSGGGRLGSATTPETGRPDPRSADMGAAPAGRRGGGREAAGERAGRRPREQMRIAEGAYLCLACGFPVFLFFLEALTQLFFFLRGGPDPAETLEKYSGPKQKKNKHPPT